MRPPKCPDRRDQNGGDRLIFGLFMAGEVVIMDTTDRANLKQLSVVSFGKDAGPHNLVLSSDDNRLMVSDYFLNEDAAGKLGAGTAALDVWLGHRGGLRRILTRVAVYVLPIARRRSCRVI